MSLANGAIVSSSNASIKASISYLAPSRNPR